jgi:DNA-binding transcriptional regulator YhcF (GntR family)
MSGIILRWVAGAGGDTVCFLLSLKNDVYMNLSFKSYGTGKLDKNSGTIFSYRHDEKLPSLYKLAKLTPAHKKAFIEDSQELRKNISELVAKNKYFVLKSHFYNKRFDEEFKNLLKIVDIGFDLDFLPFIVQANLYKSDTIANNFTYENSLFDKTLKIISKKLNPEQKKSLMWWNLTKDFIKRINEFGLDNKEIMTRDLFYDSNKVKKVLKSLGYEIDFETEFFSEWRKNNSKYLPSEKYQEYVRTKNYNYSDQNLILAERYILLALDGKNFKFLK